MLSFLDISLSVCFFSFFHHGNVTFHLFADVRYYFNNILLPCYMFRYLMMFTVVCKHVLVINKMHVLMFSLVFYVCFTYFIQHKYSEAFIR